MTNQLLNTLGVDAAAHSGGNLPVHSPIDGALIGAVHAATPADMQAAVGHAHAAFLTWRQVPAPRRGR